MPETGDQERSGEGSEEEAVHDTGEARSEGKSFESEDAANDINGDAERPRAVPEEHAESRSKTKEKKSHKHREKKAKDRHNNLKGALGPEAVMRFMMGKDMFKKSKKVKDHKPSKDKPPSDAKELDATELRALIRGVFERRNPAKLSEFDALMQKYAGSEAQVYAHVCQKYGETPKYKKAQNESKNVPGGVTPAVNGGDASKASRGFAKKASAPAPPASLRVATKGGPVLSPPRDLPSAAELFAAVESSKEGSGWPFLGEEDSQNTASESSSSSPERECLPSGVWYRPSDQSRYRQPAGIPMDAGVFAAQWRAGS
jgi:hypothetical protein